MTNPTHITFENHCDTVYKPLVNVYMELSILQKRALEIRSKYSELEKARGAQWTRGDIVKGLVGDVGDLVKLTMAKDGLREVDNVDQKLAHELADCLWSILVIAEKYNIDIETSFLKTMDELEIRINTTN